MRDLWAHATPSTCLGGAPCYAPSPEWELLYLCAHAASHRWQGRKWLADIHEVCATRTLDWSRVEATARRLRWEELVGISLALCVSLFGSPAPPSLAFRELPAWLGRFPSTDANPARHAWRALLPGRVARLCHLAAVALVPTAGEVWALRLPRPLSVLYYPLRPLRQAWRWGAWAAKQVAARISDRA